MIRPDKINQILDDLGLPVNIKVGMLRNVDISLHKMRLLHEMTTSFFRKKKQSDTNAIQITVDEVLFILGPSSANLSWEDEYEDYHHGIDEEINYDVVDHRMNQFHKRIKWMWKEKE